MPDANHVATLAFDAVVDGESAANVANPTAGRIDADATDEERRWARIVADAVGVEVGGIDDDRSRARVRRQGRTVIVEIEADDLVALRAACNTWIRLVGVAEDACALAASTADGTGTVRPVADPDDDAPAPEDGD